MQKNTIEIDEVLENVNFFLETYTSFAIYFLLFIFLFFSIFHPYSYTNSFPNCF